MRKSMFGILVSAIIVGGIALIAVNNVQANVPSATATTIQNVNQLASMGITFANPGTLVPLITKDQAVQIAAQTFAPLAATAKSVHVELQLVTDKTTKMFSPKEMQENPQVALNGLANTPCYIVTYEGINFTKSIPNHADVVNHEYNVLIDAQTGQILYGFTYR